MFLKKAEGTSYLEIIRGKHIKVKREEPGPVHLDGEPRIMGVDSVIEIVPRSLRVIVGHDYKHKE